MARILCLDTTSEFGSIAILDGDNLVEEVLLHAPDGFGHVLYDHLGQLLSRHGWTLPTIDCFAATSGPGSFTGVRVGLAAVKGLAEASGRPVAAVSNLQALAWFGSGALRATVLDARRGEIYGAVYDAGLAAVAEETVIRFPDWLASLPGDQLEFISTDFAPFRPALAGTRFENAAVTHAPRAIAAAVGHIAAERLRGGVVEDAAVIDANYIRRSDAERLWKD